MSNPLDTLRRLVSPIKSTQGVVVEISGGIVKLATPNGLVEAPDPGHLTPGRTAFIDPSKGVSMLAVNHQVYWL